MSKTVHNCQECSACCSDGEDEKVQECVRQGIDKDCTPRLDKNCSSSKLGATESKKSPGTIAGSVVGSVAVASILIAFIYWRWRKRKRSSGRIQPEAPGEQRNGSANTRKFFFLKIALQWCYSSTL